MFNKVKKVLKEKSESLSIIGYCTFWIGFPVSIGLAINGNEIAKIIASMLSLFVVVSICFLICGGLNCILKVNKAVVESNDDYYDDCGW